MNEVAIVGIGCRFPGGSDDPDSFWDFLINKRDGVIKVPSDRWASDKFYDPDPEAPGRMYTARGGFLEEPLWNFDPDFFGISPREASIMDPQQRLLLEVAWEALDDAGLASQVSGRDVGVYIGAFTLDNGISRVTPAARPFISAHTATSYTFTMLSNRISYILNLQGPSMTIDTACSSSLVALHQANRAVETGECELALAGGVNVMLHPETFVSMSKGRFLAADGRSKAFDASADGYGRGEGAGVVILKRLDKAVRDGDRIYAVVRGSGVNQDGKTSAIPVPNPHAQETLARRVCTSAGVRPEQVRFVEAHGTGTPVGDPIELSALGKVYGTAENRDKPLVVGSVKSSIGHLEAAAGIAGLIKAALTVYHRTVPPQGWLENLNPNVPFAELNITVPVTEQKMSDTDDDIFVAVNSFGYGGTNAHAILQKPPRLPDRREFNSILPILPLSGRSPDAVREIANGFTDLIANEDEKGLDAIVGAAWTRRAHHPYRHAVSFADRKDLLRKLRDFSATADAERPRALTREVAQPVFVFSGMGPQWWAMGRNLLHADREFARTAKIIDEEFISISGWSIIEELNRPESASRITDTEIAQPANFLLQVALVAEFQKLGVRPRAVVGHSVGEVSAAYVSGALNLHDSLVVSYHRARLQATTSGAMLAVGLSESDAAAVIADYASLAIAAVNGPSSVVLAGDDHSIAQAYEQLSTSGVFARELKVEVGYHSHLMDPILDELKSVLSDIRPEIPSVPLYSTVTGELVTAADWDASYWIRNVRERVRFADTIANLLGTGHRVFLELGPHPVLTGNIRELCESTDATAFAIGTLRRNVEDEVSIFRSLADMYAAGTFDNASLPRDAFAQTHVKLPRYPWQRTRCWTEPDAILRQRFIDETRYPMIGEPTGAAHSEWTAELSITSFPWLRDHIVNGSVVLPGTAYLDAALSAAAIRTGRESLALQEVRFVTPLVIDEHDVPLLQMSVEESTKRFTISSRPALGSSWTVHATGRLVEALVKPDAVDLPVTADVVTVRGDALYTTLDAHGLKYGPTFQGIVEAQVGSDFALARIDSLIGTGSDHLAHPAVLDTALQCAALLAGRSELDFGGAVVPAAVRSVRRFATIPQALTVLVRKVKSNTLCVDIDLIDTDGRQIVTLSQVEFRALTPARSVRSRLDGLFYQPHWKKLDAQPVLQPSGGSDQDFTLIVGLGVTNESTVAPLAQHYRQPSVYNVSDSNDPQCEDALTEILRVGLAGDGIKRSTVITVVGDQFDGAANVYALSRVAAAAANASREHADGADNPTHVHEPEIHMVLVTKHGVGIDDDLFEVDLAHAALVGARRSLFNEQPAFRWRLIDIESEISAAQIAAEVGGSDASGSSGRDEVCIRSSGRWGSRVSQNFAEVIKPQDDVHVISNTGRSFELEAPSSRLFQDLSWREVPRTAPAVGEIEVLMEAIGLNPKDAFKVLGVLTEKNMEGTFFEMTLGLEGAGTVSRIGPGVENIKIGDRVIVSARNMMRRYLTTDHHYASVVPAEWEPGHCSSVIPFLTAEFALLDAARLQQGETVLIHGGAGGVGLAAIQVALETQACVIATASTEERRAYLLEAGAHYAVDSRSMNFANEVLRITAGRGSDVILSSAPGEIVHQNFGIAAEFGRIVEIGKIDIYDGAVIDLRPFDHNLSLIALDLDRTMNFRPHVVRERTVKLIDKFRDGTYHHLPYVSHSMNDVSAAFEAVVRPKQIGRVVLDLEESQPEVRPQSRSLEIDPQASYLVTGGFGAFGLATARWLVREGARRLVLAGRSGAATMEAKEQLRVFTDLGVEVIEEGLDIADFDTVRSLIARIQNSGYPLRGVFHAAGVVDNSAVASITIDKVSSVFAPKVAGAVNIDRAVRDAGIELEYFVLWSSISGLMGGFPQVPYASANASLHALASNRQRRGEAVLCVDWGSMSGGGMAEADHETVKYLALVGLRPIPMDTAVEYLSECLRLDVSHAGIFDMDWSQAAATTHAVTHSKRFAAYADSSSDTADQSSAVRTKLMKLEPEKRAAYVTAVLTEILGVIMGVSSDLVDTERPLMELGLDSLMAVEFAARTRKLIGVEMSPVEMARNLGSGLSDIGSKIAVEVENAVSK